MIFKVCSDGYKIAKGNDTFYFNFCKSLAFKECAVNDTYLAKKTGTDCKTLVINSKDETYKEYGSKDKIIN